MLTFDAKYCGWPKEAMAGQHHTEYLVNDPNAWKAAINANDNIARRRSTPSAGTEDVGPCSRFPKVL